MDHFTYLTDEMLAARVKRLDELANTSEDTDEYCRLLVKQEAAATELARRREAVTP